MRFVPRITASLLVLGLAIAFAAPAHAGSAGTFVTTVQPLSFTCTDEGPSKQICECEGIKDCEDMREGNVCGDSISCDDKGCTCDWVKEIPARTNSLVLQQKVEPFTSIRKVRKPRSTRSR